MSNYWQYSYHVGLYLQVENHIEEIRETIHDKQVYKLKIIVTRNFNFKRSTKSLSYRYLVSNIFAT